MNSSARPHGFFNNQARWRRCGWKKFKDVESDRNWEEKSIRWWCCGMFSAFFIHRTSHTTDNNNSNTAHMHTQPQNSFYNEFSNFIRAASTWTLIELHGVVSFDKFLLFQIRFDYLARFRCWLCSKISPPTPRNLQSCRAASISLEAKKKSGRIKKIYVKRKYFIRRLHTLIRFLA